MIRSCPLRFPVHASPPFTALGGRRGPDHARRIRFHAQRWRSPEVRVGTGVGRVVHASPNALSILVPPGLDGGHTAVRVEGTLGETAFIELGVPIATGLHQVDNPIIDRAGRLYVTYSGARGQQAAVSIFRVQPDGTREPFVSGITNPTSMTFDDRGRLYVSSRFEGAVYRIGADGSFEMVAADLGVACGLAYGADGSLYVGDRSGTIFRVSSTGHTTAFATLPPSVAAFHLAVGPDACLYVTAPTLASYDAVYRIDRMGKVTVVCSNFGRPQGLVFDAQETSTSSKRWPGRAVCTRFTAMGRLSRFWRRRHSSGSRLIRAGAWWSPPTTPRTDWTSMCERRRARAGPSE